MKLRILPITLAQAHAFVFEHHRHSEPATGGKWAICAMRGSDLVGVAIAGRPVSKVLQRRGYMEITRVCVLEGVEGACSMLYRRCRRIGQLMGYERFVSYNVLSETGASLRAAGFMPTGNVKARQWSTKARPRRIRHVEDRVRWEASA